MIDNKFDLLDKVNILELDTNRVITSIWVIEKGIKYEVRYFWEGSAKEVYFYEWELMPRRRNNENME